MRHLPATNFRADTNAISLMEKIPLSKIKKKMIKISIPFKLKRHPGKSGRL
jgi:hypothetical protein